MCVYVCVCLRVCVCTCMHHSAYLSSKYPSMTPIREVKNPYFESKSIQYVTYRPSLKKFIFEEFYMLHPNPQPYKGFRCRAHNASWGVLVEAPGNLTLRLFATAQRREINGLKCNIPEGKSAKYFESCPIDVSWLWVRKPFNWTSLSNSAYSVYAKWCQL